MNTHVSSESEHLTSRRRDFPSLRREHNGRPLIYFDGPGGTQVPQKVIDAISAYYATCNSNTHGCFVTTHESDEMIEKTRQTVATYLGAKSSRCISFGANMTTLNFSLSKGLARSIRKGDEIVITQLDHEANRGPWLTLQEQGIVVREVLLKRDGTLDYDDMSAKVGSKTKLVAIGLASNALGTVNDVARARKISSNVGALLLVDAVHYAPHFSIDVQAMDVDFLLCSAYKFYGPHVGILYSREGLLEQIETDRLRTQEPQAPFRIETGTLNHAAIAGVGAAVEYIASLGAGGDLRSKLVSAMQKIGEHEQSLASTLYAGLSSIRGVEIYGRPFGSYLRAPTVSFTAPSLTAEQLCTRLGDKGFCTWDGHFYAIRAIEVLGLLERGGVTRIGISLYNSKEEVSLLLEEVRHIVGGH